jgi:hypothetical protein
MCLYFIGIFVSKEFPFLKFGQPYVIEHLSY